MNQLLDEMELILSDLAQTGFSTGAENCAKRSAALAEECQASGLHTAGQIMEGISELITQRPHMAQKDDGPLMEKICMAVRYIELAREKLTQQSILARWDALQSGK